MQFLKLNRYKKLELVNINLKVANLKIKKTKSKTKPVIRF